MQLGLASQSLNNVAAKWKMMRPQFLILLQLSFALLCQKNTTPNNRANSKSREKNWLMRKPGKGANFIAPIYLSTALLSFGMLTPVLGWLARREIMFVITFIGEEVSKVSRHTIRKIHRNECTGDGCLPYCTCRCEHWAA